jgi:hypothetical protein
MRHPRAVFPNVAVQRDSRAYQVFPALVKGATQRDKLVL